MDPRLEKLRDWRNNARPHRPWAAHPPIKVGVCPDAQGSHQTGIPSPTRAGVTRAYTEVI